ncbi:MAG: fibronectin type III domain-containing protein [Nitrosopumilales archaeon]|nr:fibronectin type III domain-containing protein [Nitrosopumilales archaeon]
MKTAGITLVAILLVGALVTPLDFSEAQVSNQTVPAAPTNLNATAVSSSQINLSWTAPVNSTQSQVSGYRIEIKPLCVGSFSILANTTTTATTYADTNLISGICYEYRVSAINSIGVGNPSNTASAATWSEPSEPRSLTASTVSSLQINLNWTVPLDSGGTPVNGYKIERRNSCAGSFLTIVANTSNTNIVYSDTGLTNGTCYQYRVFAHNIVGTSLSSNNATATTLQTPSLRLPSAPTGLNVSAISGTALKLTWNTPADQGNSPITGYNIQRNGTVIVNNTGTIQTSYTDTGLLFDHQQTYRVAAWNSVGLGPYSNATVGKTGTQVSTPKEIENLGQAVSSFVHKYNVIFKQQRDETIKAIKECNDKVKNASQEDRKQIKDDCKITLHKIKEKYKELRNQFKADFKEFRETTKVVLTEAMESKIITKEDVKEVKQEIKQVKNEVKKSEKEFKKELKELKKESKKSKKDKNN